MDTIDIPMLVITLGMLCISGAFLVAAVLVRRGHARATRWFGPSVKFLTLAGCFYLATSLLNLGRLLVPSVYADAYSTFFLFSSIVVGVVVILGLIIRRPTS